MNNRRKLLQTLGWAAWAVSMPGWARSDRFGSAPGVAFFEPGSEGFESARRLYNSRINRRPVVAAVCSTEAGVQAAVRRANALDLPVCIKSGGHSLAGFSVEDGGMLIDTGNLKSPRLSRDGVLETGPGLRLAELNALLLPKGRLLPAGSCGGVAVGGLALGGGYGFFSREHGLTCDHMRALSLVDGAGEVRLAQGDMPLLRACRGGGNGHFGVVTRMTFATVPAPKVMAVARFRFALSGGDQGLGLAERWFALGDSLPAWCYSAFVANGNTVTVLVTATRPFGTDAGLSSRLAEFGKAARRVEPVREEPLLQAVKRFYGQPGPLPFRNASGGFYRSFDEFKRIGSDVLARVVRHPGLIFQVNTFGPFPDGPPGAFPHRDARWIGEIQAYWEPAHPPSRAKSLEREVETVLAALDQGGIGAHYANYGDPAIRNPLSSYYGASLPGLRALKRETDPQNRFRHPQSVVP